MADFRVHEHAFRQVFVEIRLLRDLGGGRRKASLRSRKARLAAAPASSAPDESQPPFLSPSPPDGD